VPPPSLDFDQVFAESSPFVWRVLGRLGVARSDIPDVCQEVFLIVHRRRADYDGRAPLRAWIYGICVRKAAEYRKLAHRRYEELGDVVQEPGAPAQQERQVELARARQRLAAVLAELSAGQREVFVLYELEELPMAEVAGALECPVQTAYSRLHAARKAVTDAFRTRHKIGEPT
jgi:RNA polymerase sigma-70 factor (ECF subfamily)